MKKDGNIFTLECSGRTLTPHRNIIGVDDYGELTEGYDSALSLEWQIDGDNDDFTDAERREIAEYMIQRWTAYRDSLTAAVQQGE